MLYSASNLHSNIAIYQVENSISPAAQLQCNIHISGLCATVISIHQCE